MTAPADRQARTSTASNPTFALNDKQYDFVHDDLAKFCAYIGGIGAGKSFAGALKALRKAIDNPGSLGLIGAPTYPMLRDTTLRSVLDVFPEALIDSFNKTDGLLRLVNNSEILFRSTDDPDRLRGLNLAWFWLDEAPLCGYKAWRILKGRLRQPGFAHQAWATGTPHGEDDYYEDFENDPQPGHVLYRASTRDNARHLPPRYIEDLGYTGQFALQEIEGLFVNFEGLVYEFRKEWHLGEWVGMQPDGKHLRRPAMRIGGVDWGFTNPAVALPIFLDGDDRAYVVDEFYQARVGLEGVKAAVLQFTRDYGIETWYCGPDEPEHIEDLNAAFKREHLNAKAFAADDDINPGLDTVRRQMTRREDGTVGLQLSVKCAATKAEFRTYCYASSGSRREARDPADKPIKKMDHAMDALRYGLHSALGGKNRTTHPTTDWYDGFRSKPATEIGGYRLLTRRL